MSVCEGEFFEGGWATHDSAGQTLPTAYGATFDGACAVAVGDPGLVFTMAPSGASPCASLGSGVRSEAIDLRRQRCDNTVGAATWRDVRLSGIDLTPGLELTSLVVVVKDAASGAVVATREMVGSGGTIDLSAVDPNLHPSLVLEATLTSVAGNPAWADWLTAAGRDSLVLRSGNGLLPNDHGRELQRPTERARGSAGHDRHGHGNRFARAVARSELHRRRQSSAGCGCEVGVDGGGCCGGGDVVGQ